MIAGVGDRLYEYLIRNICETSLVATLYPRSAVLVNIQEMHNSGHVRISYKNLSNEFKFLINFNLNVHHLGIQLLSFSY